ncbi:uncharacterized protein LOC143919303 [Arctopsyche grandis]|uniref:uncharacterized protein LOC143919303 n=1 Tax=Arctopsyche grandis TaxID=121162 RepID=UPI00406D8A60
MASSSGIAPEESSEDQFMQPMELPFDERLTMFVRHFVIELESTLQLHYEILAGYITKSGPIPKVMETALGLFLNYYIYKGLHKVVQLFQTPMEMPFEVIEKNKSLQYYQIVYSFHRSKERGRHAFVDIAMDVFASFEFQFAGITSERGDEKAIQRVARDAAERFLNGFKSKEEPNTDASLIEKKLSKFKNKIIPQLPVPNYEMKALKVVEGKSKSKSILIPDKLWKPGYEISYRCKKSHRCKKNRVWNTSDIFEKAGVAEKKMNSEDYDVYLTNKSDGEKYGCRFFFPYEDVKQYKNTKLTKRKMCKSTCMCPENLKNKDFYESKRIIILQLINNEDEHAIQRRTLKLVEETHKDFEQYKEKFGKNNEELLSTIEIFNSQLTGIQKSLIKAAEHRDSIALENKNLQLENQKEIVSQVKENIESQFNVLEEAIRQNQIKSKRVLFRVKNPAISFSGRKNELKELHEALTNKISGVISQAASVVGLGGVGKTELAKKYVKKYKDYYFNIVFINAEKSETLLESFHTLAIQIGLKFSNIGRERDLTEIVADTYERLNGNGKTLVVFDNTEEYKYIKKFIFNNSYGENRVHTLITSRCKIWDIGDKGVITMIQLQMFTEEEAMKYLRKCLENEDEDNLKSLMDLLQRFPLGLKQAVGYIKQQKKYSKVRKDEETFNVKDYINLYDVNWTKVLHKGQGEVDDIYENTVATTWRITMQKIEESGECGILALSILKLLAYFASDDIDIRAMFYKLEQDVDKLYDAVNLLHDYSMISNEEWMVDVHRLVQKAIQIYLIEKRDEENILNEAIKLIEWCDFDVHVVSVLEHSSNYPEIVKNNFNSSKYGAANTTAIDLLIVHRHETIGIAKILKHIECDFNRSIHTACYYGNLEVLRFLINKGVELNYKNSHNETLLHVAAKGGNVKILQLLINKGLDLNIADNDGETPIFCAASFRRGRTEALRLLLKSGANPNALNSRGQTILHTLAGCDALEQFKLLLSEGVDPNTRDKNGRSPLHCAAMCGNVTIMQLLLDKGLDVNSFDNDRDTPLTIAALNSGHEAVKFLLKLGANPNAINTRGESVLHHLAEIMLWKYLNYF